MKWKNLTMPKQIAADPSNNDHYGKFVSSRSSAGSA
jgi:hypothetical protein